MTPPPPQPKGSAAARFFADPDPRRRMFWAAFLVRLLYMTLAHSYRLRLIHDHFEFGWEMGRIGRALATGYGYADPFAGHSGPTAWCPPLYPLLIGGVFKLFGVYTNLSAWVLLAINCALSAAIAPMVYEMGWRCFGRTQRGLSIALWSGWLWALYPAAMQYAVRWIWEMTLTTFLFSVVIVLALRIRGIGGPGQQTPAKWAVFGAIWGLIALSNSSLCLSLPACALWMVWPGLRAHLPLAARNLAIAAVCCLAVMSPWAIRNVYALHAFVPLRANFGAELAESVRPSNNGFPWGTTVPVFPASPEFQRYVHLGEVEYSSQQGKRAKQIIRSNPSLFGARVLQRVYFFWNSVPHPIEKGILDEFIRELNFAFLSLSGLLGLGLALRNRVSGAWLFLWIFALCPMLYYAVTVQARFRHPLEPVICILSVYLFQSADRTRAWSFGVHASGTLTKGSM